MSSLWGTKRKTDDPDQRDEGSDDRPGSSRREPDERTRLLNSNPQPPRHDGYLDPDDPAVSPYNLWTVRFLRFLTILFMALTVIWWVLLLISIFVTPPGMTTRGSGFTDFAFTTLTLGNLMVALLFFLAPSRAMRIMSAVVAVFLLVDMIIILASNHIRKEEGWVGIASVIWAFAMAVWSIIVDRVVAWGKREEEERLTGRAETRRTLKEWLAVVAATLILAIYVVIVIFMTSCLSIRARDATLDAKMWGQRYTVDGDKYDVHLACVGDQNPNVTTVILEGGQQPVEYQLQPWLHSAWINGTVDRYCFWDRPGFAWSDNAPSPHSAGMSADALYEALLLAGEDGPWVLMSAGTGTLVSRIFSGTHPHAVKGLMLVDPLHEDLLGRLSSPSRGLTLWFKGFISPLGIQRLGGALFKGRNRADRVYGRNAYQTGKYIKAQLQENLVADSLTKGEVRSSRHIQHEDVPLVVISSGIESRKDTRWKEKQEDLTKLTDELLAWDTVQKAPHEVWQTYEGRRLMEKRLGQLLKKVTPPVDDPVEVEEEKADAIF